MGDWKLEREFLSFETAWVTLRGENYLDEAGRTLEYYRVEKADSVIALPLQAGRILVPPAQYRPGLGGSTIDFPGGRVDPEAGPRAGALRVLERELGVSEEMIDRLIALDGRGWPVNSSFSNQKLYGYVAHIRHEAAVPGAGPVTATGGDEAAPRGFDLTSDGLAALLEELDCLQCRAVLFQYLLSARRGDLFPR